MTGIAGLGVSVQQVRMRVIVIIGAALLLGGCQKNEVEETVRRDMLDPDATQFRNVEPCAGSSRDWQGEVNGKNAMGGYTGFKRFYYVDDTVVHEGALGFRTARDRCEGRLKVVPSDENLFRN